MKRLDDVINDGENSDREKGNSSNRYMVALKDHCLCKIGTIISHILISPHNGCLERKPDS